MYKVGDTVNTGYEVIASTNKFILTHNDKLSAYVTWGIDDNGELADGHYFRYNKNSGRLATYELAVEDYYYRNFEAGIESPLPEV